MHPFEDVWNLCLICPCTRRAPFHSSRRVPANAMHTGYCTAHHSQGLTLKFGQSWREGYSGSIRSPCLCQIAGISLLAAMVDGLEVFVLSGAVAQSAGIPCHVNSLYGSKTKHLQRLVLRGQRRR